MLRGKGTPRLCGICLRPEAARGCECSTLTLERHMEHISCLHEGGMTPNSFRDDAWTADQVYFDAIRPISAIRHQYGDNPITAWLGPGKGTGQTTGNGYRSYLRTMQHADYPSGSACAPLH